MVVSAVVKIIKLAIEGGNANPAPPLGPALGAAGLNIMEFCKAYNAQTQEKKGEIVPVEISVMDVCNCCLCIMSRSPLAHSWRDGSMHAACFALVISGLHPHSMLCCCSMNLNLSLAAKVYSKCEKASG
jgi:hypothetical protein